MDLKKLSDEEILKLISPNSDIHNELRRRSILRTKNVTGEIGEYLVVKFYNKTRGLSNLFLPGPGVKNIDVISRKGNRYSIKTITSRNGTTGSFWNPESIKKNNKTFEFLIICVLDGDYSLELILELSWDDFFKFKRFNSRMNNFQIGLTKKLISSVKVIYDKKVVS